MTFRNPGILWLLLILLPLIVWYIYKYRKANPSLSISSTRPFDKLGTTWKVWGMHFTFALRLVGIAAIIVALARPQSHIRFNTSQIEGTDIVLSFDISGSMMAKDFRPNRFEAAKEVASKFINGRPDDNIGLVAFAGESLSIMPLTNERSALLNALHNVKMGDLSDGTAIGDGLASAINRISNGQAKSKSIILLTDGSNNAGDVPPSTAAEIARRKGIRVYTIGVGTNGSITIPDPYGFSSTTLETKIDEETLGSIAKITGGKYFRATDNNMLSDVFDEIDSLEKTRLDVERFSQTDEDFMPWVLIALVAFVAEMLMRYVVLRRIP